MQSLLYVPGSNGAANASLATIQAVRAPGAVTNTVNTVAGFPTFFYATMGTPRSTVDPVTGETITVITEASAVDFAGTLNAGKIDIVAIAPGYTDLGSKVGDIIIVRPVTEWANNLFNVLQQSLQDNGLLKLTALDHMYRPSEITTQPYVASGGIIANTTGLTGSFSDIVFYLNGLRYAKTGVANKNYTASKDTYVDIDSAGVVYYTEVANGATSGYPLVAGRVRLAKVVTSASAITSIQQSTFADGLGNLMRPAGAASVTSLQNPVRFRVCTNQTVNYAGSGQDYIPETKIIDTANAINTTTGEFTAPYDGTYDFVWWIQASPSSMTAAYPRILINGVNYSEHGQPQVTTSSGVFIIANDVPLKAGDKLKIRVIANANFTSVPSNNAGQQNGHYNWWSGRLSGR